MSQRWSISIDFLKTKFTYLTIHSCKVYNSVVFNIFRGGYTTVTTNSRTFCHTKKKPCAPSQSFPSLQPLIYFLYLWFCPLGTFYISKSCNMWPFVSGFFYLIFSRFIHFVAGISTCCLLWTVTNSISNTYTTCLFMSCWTCGLFLLFWPLWKMLL